MRLWMLRDLFLVNGDSLIYGDLAKTLLLNGRYGLTLGGGAPVPTLIRLPGYPLFLAFCFRVFGMENYFAVALVQIALELLGCLLLAEFAARIAPPRLRSGARHGNSLVGNALPLHRLLYGGTACRDSDALCACPGALGNGPLPRPARVGKCALVYLRDHLCGAPAS